MRRETVAFAFCVGVAASLSLLPLNLPLVPQSLSTYLTLADLIYLLPCLGQSPLIAAPHQYQTTDQLLGSLGYTVTSHNVTTDDGYILKVFRITGVPGNPPSATPKRSVFLNHGLAGTSNQWNVQQGQNSLPQLLADNGYDVWIGNARGNSYSSGTARPMTQDEYWDFSWHEMGIHDVPAVVDFILNASGNSKLNYIGYSMGGSQYLVGLSSVPGLNDKIETGFLLAPAGFISHCTSPIIASSIPLQLAYNRTYLTDQAFGHKINTNDLLRQYLNANAGYLCASSVTNCGICNNAMFAIFGFDSVEMNYTALPSFYANYADVIGTKCITHYGQLWAQKTFRQYDYSAAENMARYGQPTPPEYNLKNITAPTVIFYGRGDNLVPPVDVEHTVSQMKPGVVKELHLVDPDNSASQFNHLDFVIGVHDYQFIFQRILYILNNKLYAA